jgi:transketolase
MLTQHSSNKLYNTVELEQKARHIRRLILHMLTTAKSSHLGSAFSIVDVLTVLYHQILDVEKIKNKDPLRDYFILSKGHAVSALYATLMSVGVIPESLVTSYEKADTKLCGHPVKDSFPGIEASTGSLGQGLPMAVGLALAFKKDGKLNKVYALIGDGECQEGSVWEALTLAARYKLDNLTVIVDYNNQQAYGRPNDIMPGTLDEKFRAFCCTTTIINGHDVEAIYQALVTPTRTSIPLVIITHTIKGKGISFAEDKLEWHYRSANQEQFEKALKELEDPCVTSS